MAGIPGRDSRDIITWLVFTAGRVRILLHKWFKGCQTHLTARQKGFIVSYYNNAKMPPHPRVVMGSMSPSGIFVPPRAGYRTALGGTKIPSGDIKPITPSWGVAFCTIRKILSCIFLAESEFCHCGAHGATSVFILPWLCVIHCIPSGSVPS